MDNGQSYPDRSRQKSLTGIRLFADQLEALDWLIVHKYRDNRSRADLIREAVDQYVEREKKP